MHTLPSVDDENWKWYLKSSPELSTYLDLSYLQSDHDFSLKIINNALNQKPDNSGPDCTHEHGKLGHHCSHIYTYIVFLSMTQLQHIFKVRTMKAPDKIGCQENIFLISPLNICCGYSLEVPQWGASNEYPQHMFFVEK